MLPALTIPQWALLSLLCALDVGIVAVHLNHGWNCWGFFAGGLTNRKLVDGLILLMCASALYCLITATSVRGFCVRSLAVVSCLGASAFFYHQGAAALYVSFHHQPLGTISLFVASLNLGVVVLCLLGGRAKRGLASSIERVSPGAPAAEGRLSREPRERTAVLRVLLVAAVLSAIFSAGGALLEGVAELNRKVEVHVGQLLDDEVPSDPRITMEVAQERNTVWSVFRSDSWIRAFWLSRFPGVWLYTFGCCVLVGFLVTRTRRCNAPMSQVPSKREQ